ncbi:MAG: RND family transporter [Myxococcota bacterium]
MTDPVVFAGCAVTLVSVGIAVAFFRPAAIVDRAEVVLGLFALVCLGAVAALIRFDPPGFTIGVDPASEPMIRRNDPGIPAYERAKRDFGSDDVYVIAMEVADVFTAENLEALKSLNHRLRGLEGVASVESLARVLSIRWDDEREMVLVEKFIRDVPDDPVSLADLKARALADPVYRKTLISADARTAAIEITFQPMTDSEFVDRDLDGRIASLLDEETRAGRHFYVAGRPHVRSRAYHIMVRDLALLVPVAVVVSAFILWLMSGSIWGTLVPLVSCLASTLWVFGALAVLGTDINLITLVLGPMMICIGSVYGVHVYARFQLIGAEIRDRRAAVLESLRYVRTPVAMAGLTTCIGFGALLLTDVPATNELGVFSIIGVAGVTLISLTAVPASLLLLPDGAWAGRTDNRISGWVGARIDDVLGIIAELSVGRPTMMLVLWLAASVGAIAAIPRIEIDTDIITFFERDSDVRTDFEAVNRLLSGAVPIYVSITGPGEGAFRDPAGLRAVAALQAELERVPGVRHVLSSVDLIRLSNQAMNGGDPAEARIPASRMAVAEATFVLPKDKLRRYVNSNHSRANLIIRSGESGSAAVRTLEGRIHEALARVPLPEGYVSEVSANTILLNRGADGIARNQATQVGFAAATILGLIVLVFRSLPVGIISMIPNVVPVLIFFGILGLGAAPLSIPTSLIGSIALGIAVDDTMHFLVGYQTRRRNGESPEQAARECIHQVGRPIIMTSVMLVIGFLVILASGFATLQEFGVLTALTMAICLSTDLLLLPALLVRLRA